jgi:hypothetical protein
LPLSLWRRYGGGVRGHCRSRGDIFQEVMAAVVLPSVASVVGFRMKRRRLRGSWGGVCRSHWRGADGD